MRSGLVRTRRARQRFGGFAFCIGHSHTIDKGFIPMIMTPEELKKLDTEIAATRAEREKIMLRVKADRITAGKLSAKLRELEQRMPTPKQRRGLVMQAEAAKVALKPRR
jgi:hypothetical protein